MISYFAQHHDHLFYAIAAICMLVEISFLGLSGPLIFVAAGSLITGIFLSLGFIHSLSVSFVLLAGFSIATTALLWGPLKKLQNKSSESETSSDMVGKILPVTMRITKANGRVSYSGIEWLARLDGANSEPVEVHERVEVTSVDGTLLIVKKYSPN
ncbi:MAG: NfeD family protein [Gammaproteobacteria bacterium]|nr:MAG: NfeD family protein [Gammaproteobacteria bacterium]